ncbi:MAG: hypothetical protein JWO04_2137 [Gammaproteobacteria bacterium]|nr:hypothetical protein [Gammaproteobacteria bacterium]
MKGDISRNTFDRAHHYSSVRLQQGRIVTDADWNEQADLTRYRAERQARDTIGPCGAPLDAAGYALVAETNAFAVQAINANVAWMAAEDGALLRTTNGGADWSLVDLTTANNLRALAQVGGTGWAVGDGGVVRKTSNQGASWIAQNPGTLETLRGVSVFDADHVWAVGDGGIVVASSDGGATWRLAKASAARLYAVCFIDELAGLAVGQGGVILTSNDSGQSWTAVAGGTTAHLRALAVFGTTFAWAAGQGGTIVRSEDAGATWLLCNTPSAATLYAIGFRDQNEGWAAGAGGVVLHTTDGGANWSLEDVGTQVDLRGLSFFGSDPGWLVGAASTALRLGGGSPDVANIVLPAINLSIEPGRCYVNGTLCELDSRVSYLHQGGADERLAPGGYLMYLDAWQLHLSYLEAPAIREVALGGPDTASRARAVAQVRALALPQSSPFDWSCGSTVAAWDALVNAQSPVLAARAEPQLAPASLCEIAATAGYRRLENQLYRVEVHEGGANPTFKWSRENGSVAYSVVSVSIDAVQKQTTVRLAARGRDSNLDLAVNDRVELLDDDAELVNRAGVMLEYLNDGNDELELVLSGVPTGTLGQDPALHPVLRRWDHKPDVPGTNVLPIVEDTWIELEDGVQVRFGPGGEYRPGDYWQIPARTVTADVEWPLNDEGEPVARPRAGIADAYCRLGIIEVGTDGSITVVSDCRNLFPPLTAMDQLLYVSGDGQDAEPNTLLPQSLAVRVARGQVPVAGRGIRFEIESGGGTLDGGGLQFDTVTDAEGQATCGWRLGPGATAPTRFQRMRASLLDGSGQPLPGQFVVFCATASLGTTTTVKSKCEVTIGKGGDFETLSADLLRKLFEQGGGSVCVCFLPGSHVVTQLEIAGSNQFRLSLHGCGHTSLLNLRGPLTFAGFAAVEIRDLAMNAAGEISLSFEKNTEVHLTNVTFDRSQNAAKSAAVNVISAGSVSVTGCEILTTMPSMAALFQDITGTCRVTQNRFVGLVSFYGESIGAPTQDLVNKLAARKNLRLTSNDSQLSFSNNSVSQLTVAAAMVKRLSATNGTATGVFASALLHSNTFMEQNNVFVAGLLGCTINSFLAKPAQNALYGVMMATRASATGNLAVVLDDVSTLRFVVPDAASFVKAANVVTVQP